MISLRCYTDTSQSEVISPAQFHYSVHPLQLFGLLFLIESQWSHTPSAKANNPKKSGEAVHKLKSSLFVKHFSHSHTRTYACCSLIVLH